MSDYDSKRDDYASRRSKLADNGGGSSPDDALDDRDSHRKSSRTRDADKDRGYNRGLYQRGYNGRSSRVERERDKPEVYERHQGRDRHGDYKQDRERRHRQRSLSPPGHRSSNQSRSPSPSHARTKSKRTSGFDMAPPGMATLPSTGVPGQQPGIPQLTHGVVQNILSFGTTQLSLPMIPTQAITQQATRHARRVYVGGLPNMVNEQAIATFFSGVMAAIGGNSAGPGDAVVNVYINHEKKFAFVEMRTVEEASNAMALDGIIFEGVSVRVRRPTDYNPALAATLGPSQPSPHLNLAAVQVAPGGIGEIGGADRIFVGGIPYYFSEVQITELLQSFGPLQRFDLVKDKDTGNSKGYGFCYYQDPAVTDIACDALNGLKMGDKTLTVRRATVSNGQYKSEQENLLEQAQQHIMQKMALQVGNVNHAGMGMALAANAENPTKVLCLTEAITVDQLRDDEEYEEILEDMKDECSKFGSVVNVIIPRPNLNGDQISGIGKVFLEYSDTTGCTNARSILNGRRFGGNTVNATFYPEDRYYSRDYSA